MQKQNSTILLFDLGKVLFDFKSDRFFQYLSKQSGVALQDIKQDGHALLNYSLVHDYEKGKVQFVDFLSFIEQRLDCNLNHEESLQQWKGIFEPELEGLKECLVELSSKFELYGLSNTNLEHKSAWEIKYQDLLNPLKQIFCSHEMGMRKPDTEIYEALIKKLNIKPENCLYFDDSKENVRAAKGLGFQSILVTSPSDTKARLQRILNEF